jgi:hypothetical protein
MENSILYKDFIELQQAYRHVLSEFPKSKGYFDFMRAPLARMAYEKFKKGEPILDKEYQAYFIRAILPKSGEELTEAEFKRLSNELGSGIFRVSIIDKNLIHWLNNAKKNEKILITGGACALEARDTKFIQYLQSMPNGKRLTKEYVKKLFSNFPTWTQITGALIPSSKISIMYDETFPWCLRLPEYGLENAESETQKVYDAIFQGVQRYADLYDPKNIVLKVPFTSLHLKKDGYLERWFDRTKEYNKEIRNKFEISSEDNFDSFMKAWVEYTYSGPEILDIVKKTLKENYGKIFTDCKLENATIHVRAKQIDHLDTERLNGWMHYVILGNDLPKKLKERKKMLFTNHHINTIGLYNWMRDEYENNRQLGFAGFLDHSYKGKLIHEESVREKFQIKKAANKSLDLIFASPLRLSQKNVEESIKFLERFKNPNSVSFSKETLLKFTAIKQDIDKLKHKIKVVERLIMSIVYYLNLLEGLLNKKDISNTQTLKDSERIEFKNLLEQRFASDGLIKKFIVVDLKVNFDKNFIPNFINRLNLQDSQSELAIKSDSDLRFAEFFFNLLSKEKNRYYLDVQNMNVKISELDKQLKKIYENLSVNISSYQNDFYSDFVNILPLGANLFVSYMQQLLFIPSIRLAYLNLIKIEKRMDLEKEQKEMKVVAVVNRIFPVVEKCIRYIMTGGEYPFKERFEFEFQEVN